MRGRRHCKVGVFVAILFGLLVCGTRAHTQPKERKNIEGLIKNHPKELALYEYAVEKLMQSNAKKNYQYFANLHNVFTPSCDHGCEHWNDLFLPWHRSLLYEFEKALQAVDPPKTKNVTIPYWDWTEKHSGNRYPSIFENAGSVLCDKVVIKDPRWHGFHNRRNQSMSSPFFTPSQITDVIGLQFWSKFGGGSKGNDPCFRGDGGDLEHIYHDPMHSRYINGDMANPSRAARDPIFWSFHCYIDLLWDRWQKKHKTPPSSLKSDLRGMTLKKTVASVEHVEKLGYFYKHNPEDIKPPKILFAKKNLHPRSATLANAMSVPENVVAMWGGQGPFLFNIKIPKPGFRTAHLRFIQVKVPHTMSIAGEIFIYPSQTAFKPKNAAFRRKYLVDPHFAIWQGHVHIGEFAHANVTRRDMYRPVTSLFQSLAETHAGEDWLVAMTAQRVVPESPVQRRLTPKALPLGDEMQFRGVQLVLDKR